MHEQTEHGAYTMPHFTSLVLDKDPVEQDEVLSIFGHV